MEDAPKPRPELRLNTSTFKSANTAVWCTLMGSMWSIGSTKKALCENRALARKRVNSRIIERRPRRILNIPKWSMIIVVKTWPGRDNAIWQSTGKKSMRRDIRPANSSHELHRHKYSLTIVKWAAIESIFPLVDFCSGHKTYPGILITGAPIAKRLSTCSKVGPLHD